MLLAHPLNPLARAEHGRMAVAVRTREQRHVLHEPQDRHVYLAEHVDALDGVPHGERVRRRDDDGPVQHHLLRDAQLRVAGAGRQVEHQDVEPAVAGPVDLVQELLDRLEEHRPAPDDGRGLADEVADGHGPDAVGGEREELVLRREEGLVVQVEERGDGRAEDVGVEDAGAEAQAGEG